MCYSVEEEKVTVGGGSLDEGNIGGTSKTLISTGRWNVPEPSQQCCPVGGEGKLCLQISKQGGERCSGTYSGGQGWKIVS